MGENFLCCSATSRRARKSARCETHLVSPNGSRRIGEGCRDIVLIGVVLLDEAHHGVRLGHAVVDGVLRHDDP